tara:strand:- start:5807 stop:7696 length:1890 start_codon:yes stop_codon:yes gene_type:complete
MKIIYSHLLNFLNDKPSIDDLSDKLFQLGHEHEINNNIFEMDLTPNRGDCLSLGGLARDLNPFFGNNESLQTYSGKIEELNIDFENLSISDCPKISFLEIEIGEVQTQYKDYLEDYFKKLNINKVNLFTDISNYLSYELGQPTHCYDASKINKKLTFETTEIDEEFETLLDSKIKLNGENSLFKIDREVISLAGVMGGKSTACSNKTKKALIECAFFSPDSIIGKSIKYNLNSDAAHKFERGVDPDIQEKALRRFIKIVSDHAEIKTLRLKTFEYSVIENDSLEIDINKINQILGTNISLEDYIRYLKGLNFEVKDKIYVPSFRHDISTQNDLSEEIARVIGYNNIKNENLELKKFNKNNISEKADFLRRFLSSKGFNEVINFPFTQSKFSESISIDNPLDSNKSNMRTSLKDSLIENLLYNERRQKDIIKIFEFSNLYLKNETIQKIGIIASGRVGKNYIDFVRKIDSKYLENIFKECLNLKISFDEIPRGGLDTKKTSKIFYAEIIIDDLDFQIGVSEDIKKNQVKQTIYKPVSEFPLSTRDFSFMVSDLTKVTEVLNYFENIENDNLKDCFLFDFYKDQKSLDVKIGFRMIFQSNTKTLTDSEIELDVKKILEPILKMGGVSIPGM